MVKRMFYMSGGNVQILGPVGRILGDLERAPFFQ